MKCIQFFCLISTLVFCSCRFASIDKLEEAFTAAGDNAIELEKVIMHFSKDKHLSQHLDAAKYILENMPGHTSMDDANYLAYSKQLKSISMPIETDQLNKLWSGYDVRYSHDVNNIESFFLIQDIEDAFRIRDSVPWGKTMPFDIFKEYVLPYKVHTETLTPQWRMTLYNKYKHVIQGIGDPREAFAALLNYLQKQTKAANSNFSGDIDPLTMDYLKRGSCSQLCVYYIAVLRSVGLPAAYDYIDGWGNYSRSGHSWVSYIDEGGAVYTVANRDSVLRNMNPIDASTFKEHYDPNHRDFNISKKKTVYKIYRYSYQCHQNSYTNTQKRETHRLDVSKYYGLTGKANLETPGYTYVSLSTFKTGEDWREFVFAKTERGKVLFDDLGDSVIYLPTFYGNRQKKDVGKPFFINKENKIIEIEIDRYNTSEVNLKRKYPLFGNWSALWRKMRGAKIQVSDSEDFSDAIDIYTIDKTPMGSLSFKISPAVTAKFIRYVCPPASRTAIAEFRFFDKQNQRIPVVETMAYEIEDEMVSLAFDNNELTSALTEKEEYWLGASLDSVEPRYIHRIEIVPHNDGNFIDIGDRYLLCYFDEEWISLGEQIASTNILTYNSVPKGALLLLKNLSKGNDERIFTIERGRQVWW